MKLKLKCALVASISYSVQIARISFWCPDQGLYKPAVKTLSNKFRSCLRLCMVFPVISILCVSVCLAGVRAVGPCGYQATAVPPARGTRCFPTQGCMCGCWVEEGCGGGGRGPAGQLVCCSLPSVSLFLCFYSWVSHFKPNLFFLLIRNFLSLWLKFPFMSQTLCLFYSILGALFIVHTWV